MKKQILFLVSGLSLCFATSSAAQVRYGLRVGPQLSQMKFSSTAPEMTFQPVLGFLAGAVAEYETSKNVAFVGGLQVSAYGASSQYEIVDGSYVFHRNVRSNVFYAQVPILVKFQHRGFSMALGLYGGLGLLGKEKRTEESNGIRSSEEKANTRFGSEKTDDYRRLDFGGAAEAGYSFRNFRLGLHYYLGLKDANYLGAAYSQFLLTTVGRNRALGASLTYYLGQGE